MRPASSPSPPTAVRREQPHDLADFAGMQTPGRYSFASNQIALYAQDNWRIADRVRLNLGLRYDYDTDLRHDDFYDVLLDNPAYAGIENFVSDDRGNDTNNLQPRVGATWDVFGSGRLVVPRAGYGLYITRNRPVLPGESQDGTLRSAVRITVRCAAATSRHQRHPRRPVAQRVRVHRRPLAVPALRRLRAALPAQLHPGAAWQITSRLLARHRPGPRRGPQAARIDRSQPAGQRGGHARTRGRSRASPVGEDSSTPPREYDALEMHCGPVPGRQRAGLLRLSRTTERRDALRQHFPRHHADPPGRGLQRGRTPATTCRLPPRPRCRGASI